MDRLAAQLDSAASVVAAAGRSLSAAPPAAAFGADADGLPGRVGRAVHARLTAILAAHADDARDLAERLTETAETVRATRSRYEETDDLAHRRMRRIT